MDVLLLRGYASAGMCLPSRCLTMSLYVTIYIFVEVISFCRMQNSKIAALKICLLRFQFDGSNHCTIAVRNKESSTKRGCKLSYKLCVKYYL
jgi:hypothetical protein